MKCTLSDVSNSLWLAHRRRVHYNMDSVASPIGGHRDCFASDLTNRESEGEMRKFAGRPFDGVFSSGFCVILLFCLCTDWVASAETSPPSLYGPGPEHWLFDQLTLINLREHYHGCDVNDIRCAASTASSWPRSYALVLIAHDYPGQAMPGLKEALKDPSPDVRCMAARLLGIRGDTSGFPVMRHYISELTSQDDAAIRKFAVPQKGVPGRLQSRSRRLGFALDAAKVLAEFGDTGGYTIAAKATLNERSTIRMSAIYVLAELGRLDEDTLRRHACDPEGVLIAMIESETNQTVLKVLGCSAAARMRPEVVSRIFEKLQSSPHLSDEFRSHLGRICQYAWDRAYRAGYKGRPAGSEQPAAVQ